MILDGFIFSSSEACIAPQLSSRISFTGYYGFEAFLMADIVDELQRRRKIVDERMEDLLHPTKLGHELMAECMLEQIQGILATDLPKRKESSSEESKASPSPSLLLESPSSPLAKEEEAQPAPQLPPILISAEASPSQTEVQPKPKPSRLPARGYCSFSGCPLTVLANPNSFCHKGRNDCVNQCNGEWCIPAQPRS